MKKGANYEFVVDMVHENEQKEHREAKAAEEARMPADYWHSKAQLDQARRDTERKTNQILTSNTIDQVLKSTKRKLGESDTVYEEEHDYDNIT